MIILNGVIAKRLNIPLHVFDEYLKHTILKFGPNLLIDEKTYSCVYNHRVYTLFNIIEV